MDMCGAYVFTCMVRIAHECGTCQCDRVSRGHHGGKEVGPGHVGAEGKEAQGDPEQDHAHQEGEVRVSKGEPTSWVERFNRRVVVYKVLCYLLGFECCWARFVPKKETKILHCVFLKFFNH